MTTAVTLKADLTIIRGKLKAAWVKWNTANSLDDGHAINRANAEIKKLQQEFDAVEERLVNLLNA